MSLHYVLNGKEVVAPAPDIPLPLDGAPCPMMLYDDNVILLAYYTDDTDGPLPDLSRPPVMVDRDSVAFPVCVLRALCFAVHSDQTNHKTLQRHPLAASGLEVSGVFQVSYSPWISELAPPVRLVQVPA